MGCKRLRFYRGVWDTNCENCPFEMDRYLGFRVGPVCSECRLHRRLCFDDSEAPKGACINGDHR